MGKTTNYEENSPKDELITREKCTGGHMCSENDLNGKYFLAIEDNMVNKNILGALHFLEFADKESFEKKDRDPITLRSLENKIIDFLSDVKSNQAYIDSKVGEYIRKLVSFYEATDQAKLALFINNLRVVVNLNNSIRNWISIDEKKLGLGKYQ